MKFKNIKKKESKKSPSNSRTNPEPFKFYLSKLNHKTLLKIYSGSLKVFVVLIFIVTSVIVGVDLHRNISDKKDIDMQREKLTKNLKFWEDFIIKNKNYRDAYFQASILEYRLGNSSKAKLYAEKGLALDPNSEDGRKLEQFFVSK